MSEQGNNFVLSKLKTLIFISILLIAIFLRFYKLGVIPDGLQQDESSLGYNSYSILKTGKDEHGIYLPQNFKAFGEYKLPGYIYASVLPIKIFGLNPFSIRFISAVSGVITVIAIYFISEFMISLGFISLSTESGSKQILHFIFPFLSMFLLAINPWHLHFSRAAYEVMLASCLVSIGMVFFLFSVKTKKYWLLLITEICFIGSIYTYNIARAFIPFYTLILILEFKNYLKSISRKYYVSLIFIGVIFLIPFVTGFLTPGGANSTKGTIILTSAVIQSSLIEFRSFFAGWPLWITRIFFNTWIMTFWQYVNNIISYFSTTFYFVNAGLTGNNTIGTSGQWYQFEIIFILSGIYTWIKLKKWNNFILCWILAVIAVASLTREAPQATRSFLLIVPVTIISAYGCIIIMSFIKNTNSILARSTIFTGFSLLIIYYIFLYFASYYFRFPIYYAKNWRTGDRDVSLYIKKNYDKYETIIFDSDVGFMYTSLLTYLAYPPLDFQKQTRWTPDDSEGFSKPISFGKIEFKKINWDEDIKKSNVLIITTAGRKPDKLLPLITFYYPERPVSFAVGQTIIRYPVQEISYVLVASK
jgi:hypothetical protein